MQLSKETTTADISQGEPEKTTHLDSHIKEDTWLTQVSREKVTWKKLGIPVLQALMLLRRSNLALISNKWRPA